MDERPTKRQRRAARAEQAHLLHADEVFGIRLHELASGRFQLKWTSDPAPDLALMAVPRLTTLLEAITVELVLECRAGGDSWSDVGFMLGVTGEAARSRFSGLEAQWSAAVSASDLEGGES